MEAGGLTAGAGLPPIDPRRRLVDRAARGFLLAATLLALLPLILLLYYLIKKGIGAWNFDFFTTDPTGNFSGDQGGIKSAILGTIEIVGVATVIAIPIGIGVALYLTEYGKSGILAQTVRFMVDVMTGVPSVIFGLFIYITLVLARIGGNSFAGWKGSVALALVALPIVTRSAEVVLRLVPDGLREAALALGAPRWRVMLRVVLPTALPGLVTGSMLAVARAAGETAPLIFVSGFVNATTANLNQPMSSLPALIFNYLKQPSDALVQRAWGAALTLVVMIMVLSLIARLAQNRSRV